MQIRVPQFGRGVLLRAGIVASTSAWSLLTRANDGPALCRPLWWPSSRALKAFNPNAVNLPKDQTVHVFLGVICFKPHRN